MIRFSPLTGMIRIIAIAWFFLCYLICFPCGFTVQSCIRCYREGKQKVDNMIYQSTHLTKE